MRSAWPLHSTIAPCHGGNRGALDRVDLSGTGGGAKMLRMPVPAPMSSTTCPGFTACAIARR